MRLARVPRTWSATGRLKLVMPFSKKWTELRPNICAYASPREAKRNERMRCECSTGFSAPRRIRTRRVVDLLVAGPLSDFVRQRILTIDNRIGALVGYEHRAFAGTDYLGCHAGEGIQSSGEQHDKIRLDYVSGWVTEAKEWLWRLDLQRLLETQRIGRHPTGR